MQMDVRAKAVSAMQNYIAKHYDEEISMAKLARAAMYSPWQCYKVFKLYTGYTVAEYIRKFRLSESAKRLKNENVKICDVAFETGFGSVDGYQRAFYRAFGCNPKEYAENPVPVPLFIPYDVKFRYLERRNKEMSTKNIFIQQIEKPARKAIIRRGKKAADYFMYCEEVGCDIWGLLTSMDSLCGEPISMWLPAKMIVSGTSEYVQGVEKPLDFHGDIPTGFEIIDLPAATYLIFRGEPFAEEDFEQAIREVQEAEKKYDPAFYGLEWDEENPRIQLEPIGTRGYIELLPVKKK